MIDSATKPSVLIVDDESGILDSLNILLRNEGFTPHLAHGGKAGLERIAEMSPDIVLTDVRMPNVTGVEILAAARLSDPDVPVILMTAQATLQSAMQAVNEGAFYYIQKPFGNDELVAILRRAAEHRKLRVENKSLKQAIRRHERQGVSRPIGSSKVWLDIVRLVETVAPTDSTVLLQGESGTGKEVIARYLHELSSRADGSFLSINCGALPEGLLESELFGHVKGSFTGAVRDKLGLFSAASKGTFFLDEIGETTPATQVKLLRALQHREVIPVGSTEAVAVDTRVIAATNRDLDEQIRGGHFRSDLYYRLNVIAIHLPPLRQRRDDIPLLAEHFLQRVASLRAEPPKQLSLQAAEILREYAWPGNVRELENALERAIILTPGEEIGADALPDRVRERRAEPLVSSRTPPNPTLEAVERAYIMWVLQAEGGNKSRTAEVLGIDPSTLYRKLFTLRSGAMTAIADSPSPSATPSGAKSTLRGRTPIDRSTLRLSVLIPVYNERETIELIVDQVRAAPFQLEIICVDDHSTDGTQQVLETLLADGRIDQLFRQPVNRGKGAAIRQALSMSTGDIVIVQDADLEYDPSDWPVLFEPILDGRADACFGSRFLGGPHRVLYYWHSVGNSVLTTYSNMLTNLNLTDMETCYKAMRGELARSLVPRLTAERFGFEPEITARLAHSDARIFEVPISYSGRTYAEGKKIGWKDGIAAFWHITRFNLFS